MPANGAGQKPGAGRRGRKETTLLCPVPRVFRLIEFAVVSPETCCVGNHVLSCARPSRPCSTRQADLVVQYSPSCTARGRRRRGAPLATSRARVSPNRHNFHSFIPFFLSRKKISSTLQNGAAAHAAKQAAHRTAPSSARPPACLPHAEGAAGLSGRPSTTAACAPPHGTWPSSCRRAVVGAGLRRV